MVALDMVVLLKILIKSKYVDMLNKEMKGLNLVHDLCDSTHCNKLGRILTD